MTMQRSSAEEIETVKSDLAEKVDEYLTYAVQSMDES